MIMSEKLMSNIINSHNININNTFHNNCVFGAKHDVFGSIEAPMSLPTFSIDKYLQEKDEFRQELKHDIYINKKKEEKKLSKSTLIIAGLTAAILFLFGKKKVK